MLSLRRLPTTWCLAGRTASAALTFSPCPMPGRWPKPFDWISTPSAPSAPHLDWLAVVPRPASQLWHDVVPRRRTGKAPDEAEGPSREERTPNRRRRAGTQETSDMSTTDEVASLAALLHETAEHHDI